MEGGKNVVWESLSLINHNPEAPQRLAAPFPNFRMRQSNLLDLFFVRGRGSLLSNNHAQSFGVENPWIHPTPFQGAIGGHEMAVGDESTGPSTYLWRGRFGIFTQSSTAERWIASSVVPGEKKRWSMLRCMSADSERWHVAAVASKS